VKCFGLSARRPQELQQNGDSRGVDIRNPGEIHRHLATARITDTFEQKQAQIRRGVMCNPAGYRYAAVRAFLTGLQIQAWNCSSDALKKAHIREEWKKAVLVGGPTTDLLALFLRALPAKVPTETLE
jgi:hypothetical protein